MAFSRYIDDLSSDEFILGKENLGIMPYCSYNTVFLQSTMYLDALPSRQTLFWGSVGAHKRRGWKVV